jgi:hypothetical protein
MPLAEAAALAMLPLPVFHALLPLLAVVAQAPREAPRAPEGVPAELRTRAEQSDFVETGRYEEVDRLCHAWAARWPDKVRCFPFGQTPEGRALWAMAVSGRGLLSPDKARAEGVPVVLALGGTHAGEIDGKDAGLLHLRSELLAGSPALDGVVCLFVPVLNADGHELRGRHRRPNQAGPVEQGARVTSQRINLNRDFTVASAPETQALLELLGAWDPLLLLDFHVTDGARFQHDVSLSAAPAQHGSEKLAATARALRDEAAKALTEKGHLPLPFYPQWKDRGAPLEGLVLDADPPRHGHAYWGLHNRLAVLVENHSWKPFSARVKTAQDVLATFLSLAATQRSTLLEAVRAADAAGASLGGKKVSLDFETHTSGKAPSTVAFLGYEHEVLAEAPVFGGRGLVYFEDSPKTWTLPFYDGVHAVDGTTVALPRGGYVVPASWAEGVGSRLRLHGVEYRTLAAPLEGVEAEVQRPATEELTFDTAPFQGRQMLRMQGTWRKERVDVAAGALFVPIAQPRGLLAAHLLEPQAPDSLSAWGLFNAAYEVSDYTAEYRELELARWMAGSDPRIRELYGEALFARLPALQKAFEKRLAEDPVFAQSRDDRKAFWMAHVPPQDPELNRYPVFRVASSLN